MINGKAFSSLDGTTCSYQCSDQFQFLPGHTLTIQGIGFLGTLKSRTNLFKNNLNNTRNNMKSQIQQQQQQQQQKRIMELWNY